MYLKSMLFAWDGGGVCICSVLCYLLDTRLSLFFVCYCRKFPRVVRGTPYPVLGGGYHCVPPGGDSSPWVGGEESLGGEIPLCGGICRRGYIISPSYKLGGGLISSRWVKI